MFEFKLADVGEGMHEAEIIRWLVKSGERVKIDQPVLEIQTDKAIVELPAPVAGTVGELRFKEGQMAHVGDVLLTFETATKAAEAPKAEVVAIVDAPATPTPGTNGVAVRGPGAVRAAPAVRKRAVELDVDISQVPPGSPDGRVLLQDVEAFAKSGGKRKPALAPTQQAPAPVTTNGNGHHQPVSTETAPTSALDERRALVGLRRRIAERMELSWRTIPHVAVFDEADGTELVALRSRLLPTAEKRGTKLTYLPLIVKAVVQVLKQFPVFNASLDEQSREIIYKHSYHIGLATNTPDGLLVPVVKEADKLSLLALAAEINRLGEGGRTRTLKATELSGSTFTISNVGSYGGLQGTAIINPPEAAIVVVGKLQERAVVRSGEVVARPMLPLSLSFDHRLIDGAEAGAFVTALKEILENPSLLLLE